MDIHMMLRDLHRRLVALELKVEAEHPEHPEHSEPAEYTWTPYEDKILLGAPGRSLLGEVYYHKTYRKWIWYIKGVSLLFAADHREIARKLDELNGAPNA